MANLSLFFLIERMNCQPFNRTGIDPTGEQKAGRVSCHNTEHDAHRSIHEQMNIGVLLDPVQPGRTA